MGNFKYFKHKNDNNLATQSTFSNALRNRMDIDIDVDDSEYFELQVEIAGVMHSKLKRYTPTEWEEITNNEFINLITHNE